MSIGPTTKMFAASIGTGLLVAGGACMLKAAKGPALIAGLAAGILSSVPFALREEPQLTLLSIPMSIAAFVFTAAHAGSSVKSALAIGATTAVTTVIFAIYGMDAS